MLEALYHQGTPKYHLFIFPTTVGREKNIIFAKKSWLHAKICNISAWKFCKCLRFD